MTYTFFFSYAREDFDSYMRDFFKRLYDEIRIRKGDSSRICFFDQKTIRLGERWEERLLEAAQESYVLVPLYSPAYFKSDYCGREWQLFRLKEEARRAGRGGASTPPLIKPVIWYPSVTLPSAVSGLQHTIGPQSAAHNRLGLYDVCKQRTGRHKAAYYDFLSLFADEVMATVHALKEGQPHPAAPLRLADVTNPFPDANSPLTPRETRPLGPRFVYFFVLAQDVEWQPYEPPEPSPIGPLAQRVTSDPTLNYIGNVVPCGLESELVERIREAERTRNIAIVLVDGRNADNYERQLWDLDQLNFYNCSIFVPWNAADPAVVPRLDELRKMVRAKLPRWSLTKLSIYFHDEIYSATQLSEELRRTLVSLQANIIATAEVDPRRNFSGGAIPRLLNTRVRTINEQP